MKFLQPYLTLPLWMPIVGIAIAIMFGRAGYPNPAIAVGIAQSIHLIAIAGYRAQKRR
jgi:hypothetical protein